MAINDPANKLAEKINDIVDSKIRKKTKKSPVIKSGKVVKIDENGMPWVSVSGSDEATPVNGEALANVKPGDLVSVNIENGKCNILGNPDDPSIGSNEAKNVSNQEIKPVMTEYIGADGIEISERIPEFDYKIVAQKMSPYQREGQNQLAIQLFQMGVFNPQLADQVLPFLEMMNFEGIDSIKKKVSENAKMYEQLLQMTNLAMQMAQQLDAQSVLATGDPNSTPYMQQVSAIAGENDPAMGVQGAPQPRMGGINGLPATDSTMATKARERAQQSATPR